MVWFDCWVVGGFVMDVVAVPMLRGNAIRNQDSAADGLPVTVITSAARGWSLVFGSDAWDIV